MAPQFSIKMFLTYSSINAHKFFCNKGVEFEIFQIFWQFFDDFSLKNQNSTPKTAFLPHFCTLDIFFGMFSCSDPRQSIHFLKAQDVSFHLHQLSWAYPSNTRLQTFFSEMSSTLSSDLEVCHRKSHSIKNCLFFPCQPIFWTAGWPVWPKIGSVHSNN